MPYLKTPKIKLVEIAINTPARTHTISELKISSLEINMMVKSGQDIFILKFKSRVFLLRQIWINYYVKNPVKNSQ